MWWWLFESLDFILVKLEPRELSWFDEDWLIGWVTGEKLDEVDEELDMEEEFELELEDETLDIETDGSMLTLLL